MRKNRPVVVLVVIGFLLVLAVGAAVLAQGSASFNLDWHVVGSGGGESASASYRVQGTIGQSMSGPPDAAGATYAMTSGYWVFGARRTVYLPTVARP